MINKQRRTSAPSSLLWFYKNLSVYLSCVYVLSVVVARFRLRQEEVRLGGDGVELVLPWRLEGISIFNPRSDPDFFFPLSNHKCRLRPLQLTPRTHTHTHTHTHTLFFMGSDVSEDPSLQASSIPTQREIPTNPQSLSLKRPLQYG